MAKNEFTLAFNDVLEDKQLSKEVIISAIESAMVSAYRRAVGASAAQHVEAKIDPDSGKLMVFAEKEVVEDIIEPKTEVLLEEARKVNSEAQLGDMVIVETTPANFGRVAAQTARQVIQQRIREAERSNQMQYFERQVGEIISGIVQATNAQTTTVGLDMKAEGTLPASQRIPGERFRVHDRIRAVVLEVKDGPRGPQIILSRAHRNFLRRLLENEVPEIYHGVVEIRAISREPGARAKVAVSATQPGIDPVGACVGIKGVRIQAIVKELHDEKIDIIQWDPDPMVYITKAISPARVAGVYLADVEGARTATVVVGEDQLSLAIGRDGQNARLAAKLTGWRIDIKSTVEAAADTIVKLQNDPELANLMPNAVESISAIEEVLAKKAENRPVTPEEYDLIAKFIDRVERRTSEMKAEAVRVAEGDISLAEDAGVPAGAFDMPLANAGIKEHVFNILTEAGIETVGSLMVKMKLDPNSVLGLSGIGPKAIQNIEESLAALTFPEAAPAEPEVAPEPEPEVVPESVIPEPATDVVVEAQAVVVDEAVSAAETQAGEKQVPAKKDARKRAEEDEEDEGHKDGVSLDDLFTMKPEIFQAPVEEDDDDESKGKKKGKKGKKKSVALEFDEELGEVVSRKKHKRGDENFGEEW